MKALVRRQRRHRPPLVPLTHAPLLLRLQLENLEPPSALTLGCCGRRGARDRSARLMREAISSHQRSSAVISGHQRPSARDDSARLMREAISAHQRSSAVIRGPSAVIRGPSAVISGHQRPSERLFLNGRLVHLMREAIRGHQRPSARLFLGRRLVHLLEPTVTLGLGRRDCLQPTPLQLVLFGVGHLW